MAVIKRSKSDSSQSLVEAIEKFNILLETQDEQEAMDALNQASQRIQSNEPGSVEHQSAVQAVIDAFDEHELMAYTYQRPKSEGWTEADALSQASSRVLSLAKRMV